MPVKNDQPEESKRPKVIDSKEYSLKPIETQLLGVVTQQMQTIISNVVSFIALERLAVQITPQTRFQLNDDMSKVTVETIEEPAPPEETGVIETPTQSKKG